MRALKFITGHMVYNTAYTYITDDRKTIILSLAYFIVPLKIGYPILKKIVDYEFIFIHLAI